MDTKNLELLLDLIQQNACKSASECLPPRKFGMTVQAALIGVLSSSGVWPLSLVRLGFIMSRLWGQGCSLLDLPKQEGRR